MANRRFPPWFSYRFTKKRSQCLLNGAIFIPLIVICLLISLISTKVKLSTLENQLKLLQHDRSNTRRTQGDCQAIGPKQPLWADRGQMIRSLHEFSRIYGRRPFKNNTGGMRFHHSFGLWFMLRALDPQPSAVIESGANRGHSTWLIRQSVPKARIITITPGRPLYHDPNGTYFAGRHFKDFNSIDWTEIGIDVSNTVILFDDHQSAFRRIFLEARKMGFTRFFFDDNCEYQQCDALSMKWLCEIERRDEWMGYVRDNFGKVRVKQSWKEHLKQVEELARIKSYYEFPPATGIHRGVEPLVADHEKFTKLVGSVGRDSAELRSYAYMCFVEIANVVSVR